MKYTIYWYSVSIFDNGTCVQLVNMEWYFLTGTLRKTNTDKVSTKLMEVIDLIKATVRPKLEICLPVLISITKWLDRPVFQDISFSSWIGAQITEYARYYSYLGRKWLFWLLIIVTGIMSGRILLRADSVHMLWTVRHGIVRRKLLCRKTARIGHKILRSSLDWSVKRWTSMTGMFSLAIDFCNTFLKL